jgi:hypothetical protein
MRSSVKTGLAVGVACCLSGSLALAQDNTTTTTVNPNTGTTTTTTAPTYGTTTTYDTQQYDRDIAEKGIHPPRNAFELQVRGGYNQPFGRFSRFNGGSVTDVTQAGGDVNLGLSLRGTPHSSIGVTGGYGQYGSDQPGTAIRSVVAGLDYTYHAMPDQRLDPWLSVGVGYRAMWIDPNNQQATMLHGFQLARVMLGLDAVATDDMAFGPYIGADLNMFLWQSGPVQNNDIPGRGRVATFVSAGVSGRFDMGGTRDRRAPVVASSAHRW